MVPIRAVGVNMGFNLPAFILTVITLCFCIIILVAVLVSFISSIKNRMKDADRVVSNLQRLAEENPKRLPPSIRLLAGIYVFFSITILAAILLLIVVGLASDLGFLSFKNITAKSLNIISAAILLGGAIMTAVLTVVSRKINKS